MQNAISFRDAEVVTYYCDQKSPEWFEARRGRITGSVSGAILGNNPYKSRKQAMKDMVLDMQGQPSTFTGNEATRHGEEQEPLAREWYARKHGVTVEQVGGYRRGDFFVSPDGMVGFQGAIEIKAPFSQGYRSLDEVPYYRDQIQLLLNVTGRKWCDFIIWYGPTDVVVERVERDPSWMERNLPSFEQFLQQVQEAMADPAKLEALMPKEEREDDDWRGAVAVYRSRRDAKELAEKLFEEAREQLEALAPNGGKGFGLSLVKVERQGSIGYAAMVKKLLPNVDVEPYRGKSSVYYRVDDDSV